MKDNLETSLRKKANWPVVLIHHMGARGLSKVIRVRFRGGVLVPEEPLDMEENKELLVKIIDVEERKRILEKYRGALGRVDPRLLEEAIEEAEHL